MTALDPIPYTDARLRRILSSVRTIAMVGASIQLEPAQLLRHEVPAGRRAIASSRSIPALPARNCWARRVYASLRDIPEAGRHGRCLPQFGRRPARVVGRRRSRSAPRSSGCRLGVRNDEAAAKAEAAGLEVVMNRCPKIEYRRLRRRIVAGTASIPTSSSNRAPQSRQAARERQAAPAPPDSNNQLRLRDAAPCMPARPPIPPPARAHADLPDHHLCVRRCRPRRLAVQPAEVRLSSTRV